MYGEDAFRLALWCLTNNDFTQLQENTENHMCMHEADPKALTSDTEVLEAEWSKVELLLLPVSDFCNVLQANVLQFYYGAVVVLRRV